MNVDYINPFINASIDVFKTFANVNSHPGRPVIRTQPMADGDVNGFIELNGHGINGYFIINFSRDFLKEIIVNLFDTSETPLKEELNDLAGELTNMITGSAKAKLSQKGFFFDVAVPRISHAAQQIPLHMKTTPIIMVPFDTESGKFYIEASIKKIEEDFAQDTMPEVLPPRGMISVDLFSQKTGIDSIKIRRLLKTGYLKGEKISNRQWHIPEKELEKIQPTLKKGTTSCIKNTLPPKNGQDTVSVMEFTKLSGLSSAKIKSFLRSGFLKGSLDENNTWLVNKDQILKFNKNT